MISSPFYIESKNQGKIDESVRYVLAPGFSKLDYESPEIVDAFYKSAELNVKQLEKMQFELLYYGRVSKSDSDGMTMSELSRWYHMVADKKAEEAKSLDQLTNT